MTAELKALALAATPIDPDLYGDRYFGGDYSRYDFTKEQDAFVRAANPAAILALIEENEALRKDAERMLEPKLTDGEMDLVITAIGRFDREEIGFNCLTAEIVRIATNSAANGCSYE
jgi:hypothetical protein